MARHSTCSSRRPFASALAIGITIMGKQTLIECAWAIGAVRASENGGSQASNGLHVMPWREQPFTLPGPRSPLALVVAHHVQLHCQALYQLVRCNLTSATSLR